MNALQLRRDDFHTKNFVADFLKTKCDFTRKMAFCNARKPPICTHFIGPVWLKTVVVTFKATTEPLYVIDFSKPFNLFVDTSGFSTSSILTQTGPDGRELPIDFSSTKLNSTQCAWSTIESEAYAALVALQKYHNWIFGSEVTLNSDHNPLQYLTESVPKSAKLMR